jgi:hypothetical protein
MQQVSQVIGSQGFQLAVEAVNKTLIVQVAAELLYVMQKTAQ